MVSKRKRGENKDNAVKKSKKEDLEDKVKDFQEESEEEHSEDAESPESESDDAPLETLADLEEEDMEDANGSDDSDDDSSLDGEDEMDTGEGESKKHDDFATSMQKLLGSSLKSQDRNASIAWSRPILSRSKGIERKIEDEKLDYKARKALSAEKKEMMAKDRIIPDFTTMEYEKKLKKLFNAIRVQQKAREDALMEAASKSKTLNAQQKAKEVSTMSKSSFLDLLKEGSSAKSAKA